MKFIRESGYIALLTAAIALGGSAVSAATTSFSFSGNVMPTESLNFKSADGQVGLKVTAGGFFTGSGDLTGAKFNVGQYLGGLGICSGTVDLTREFFCRNDDHQIDGNLNEMAVLAFDKAVTILSATFSLIGADDQFAVRVYEGAPDKGFNGSIDPGSNGTPTYKFNTALTGTIFGIGAQGDNDEFKLAGITVSYMPTTVEPPAPVPLPAAGWMLLAGLGGLAAMRRRKKA